MLFTINVLLYRLQFPHKIRQSVRQSGSPVGDGLRQQSQVHVTKKKSVLVQLFSMSFAKERKNDILNHCVCSNRARGMHKKSSQTKKQS